MSYTNPEQSSQDEGEIEKGYTGPLRKLPKGVTFGYMEDVLRYPEGAGPDYAAREAELWRQLGEMELREKELDQSLGLF